MCACGDQRSTKQIQTKERAGTSQQPRVTPALAAHSQPNSRSSACLNIHRMSSLHLNFSITKLVQRHMQKLYPLALADKSWDNVGLLLEPPLPRPKPTHTRPKVLLTIDLTVPVAQEALDDKSGVETIVTYRMTLPLKFQPRPTD